MTWPCCEHCSCVKDGLEPPHWEPCDEPGCQVPRESDGAA